MRRWYGITAIFVFCAYHHWWRLVFYDEGRFTRFDMDWRLASVDAGNGY